MTLTYEDLPTSVVRYAKIWGLVFQMTHPNWKSQEGYVLDEWRSRGDYDINLFCEDGYLSVCVYKQTTDDLGDTVTDYDYFVRVVGEEQVW
jgi:hypothetical protein